MTDAIEQPARPGEADGGEAATAETSRGERGKTVHGKAANAGHRVLAPDDAEVEAYLETALDARRPTARTDRAGAASAPTPSSSSISEASTRSSSRAACASWTCTRSCCRSTRHTTRSSDAAARDHPVGRPELGVRRRRAGPRPGTWSGGLPVLGICYGAQLMARELGGDVLPATRREYGPATVTVTDAAAVRGMDREQPVWMSHGDSITRLPRAFARPPRPIRRRSPAWSTRIGASTGSSSTPRSCTRRAAATSSVTSSSASPASGPPGRRPTSSRRP